MTSTTNSLFNVNGIDLANYINSYAATAKLTGTFANNTTISTTYVLGSGNGATDDFTTELLSGFTNLKSLTIEAPGNVISIDNIVLNQVAAATADVPEPASLAILGLVGIAAARRRKSA